MWKQQFIHTDRGTFEVFTKGQGDPLCITHLYSQFNETGDYFAKEFRSFDVSEQLANVTTKTLILCGQHDVQCPIASSLQIHKGIRDSSFIPFENSNHYTFLEEQEKFSSVITAFYHSLKEGSEHI
ncbi:hypothetical protein V7166_08860 [Bacillus thuringiensis]